MSERGFEGLQVWQKARELMLKCRRQGENEPGSNLVVREVRATYSVTEPTLVSSLPRSPVNSLPHSPVNTLQGDDQ